MRGQLLSCLSLKQGDRHLYYDQSKHERFPHLSLSLLGFALIIFHAIFLTRSFVGGFRIWGWLRSLRYVDLLGIIDRDRHWIPPQVSHLPERPQEYRVPLLAPIVQKRVIGILCCARLLVAFFMTGNLFEALSALLRLP